MNTHPRGSVCCQQDKAFERPKHEFLQCTKTIAAYFYSGFPLIDGHSYIMELRNKALCYTHHWPDVSKELKVPNAESEFIIEEYTKQRDVGFKFQKHEKSQSYHDFV